MSGDLYAQSALHRMVRYDARAEIMSSIGDISKIHLNRQHILVAPYVHSGVMHSDVTHGFPLEERLSCEALYRLYDEKRGFRVDSLSKEGIFQGKVALVLKISEFVDFDDPKFESCRCAVGDWIFTTQEMTRGVSIAFPGAKRSRVLKELGIDYLGWPCKFMLVGDVYGRLDEPEMIV